MPASPSPTSLGPAILTGISGHGWGQLPLLTLSSSTAFINASMIHMSAAT